jgi:hypothetical protein
MVRSRGCCGSQHDLPGPPIGRTVSAPSLTHALDSAPCHCVGSGLYRLSRMIFEGAGLNTGASQGQISPAPA